MDYMHATLILHETGREINETNLKAVLEAAGAEVIESRVKALVAALEGVDIEGIAPNPELETTDGELADPIPDEAGGDHPTGGTDERPGEGVPGSTDEEGAVAETSRKPDVDMLDETTTTDTESKGSAEDVGDTGFSVSAVDRGSNAEDADPDAGRDVDAAVDGGEDGEERPERSSEEGRSSPESRGAGDKTPQGTETAGDGAS